MLKHTSFLFLGLMTAGLLHAERKEVQWDQLCRVSSGHDVSIQTQTGETVYGYCAKVTADELTIHRPGQGAVTIARSALAKFEMKDRKGGQLKKLRREFRHAMSESAGLLLTPAGLAGVVAVPVVAVWGVTALPFCALGDLVASQSSPVELRPI